MIRRARKSGFNETFTCRQTYLPLEFGDICHVQLISFLLQQGIKCACLSLLAGCTLGEYDDANHKHEVLVKNEEKFVAVWVATFSTVWIVRKQWQPSKQANSYVQYVHYPMKNHKWRYGWHALSAAAEHLAPKRGITQKFASRWNSVAKSGHSSRPAPGLHLCHYAAPILWRMYHQCGIRVQHCLHCSCTCLHHSLWRAVI